MTKCLIDSNVLVAAYIQEHEHHSKSLYFLSQSSVHNTYATCHTLAEFFSSSTALPYGKALPPPHALLCIENIKSRLQCVPLTEQDYFNALTATISCGSKGGRIYDALHMEAARKLDVEIVVTWNTKHFIPLAEGSKISIRTPDYAY